MASINITVPDALLPRIVVAMRSSFPQYSGLSDGAAFKAVTADNWKNILSGYERAAAESAAATKALTDSSGIG